RDEVTVALPLLASARACDRCAKRRVIECYRPETVIPAAVGSPGPRQMRARPRPRRHRSSRAVVRLCKGRCYRPAAVGLCACRQPYRCGVRSVLGRTRSIAGGGGGGEANTVGLPGSDIGSGSRRAVLNLPLQTTKQVCTRLPLPQEERQASSSRSQLQRLDSDLAELDHALAELQRHWSFGMRPAADARGFLAVEHDGKIAALGRNLHRAPLATGLRHRVDLGVIDDGAGAVARVGARVEDVALVAGFGAGLVGVLATDEDAAVGIVADPELSVDLEVFVFVLRDQESGGLGVLLVLGHDRAVFDREIGVAVTLPVIKVLAVEERNPAFAGLGLRRTSQGI